MARPVPVLKPVEVVKAFSKLGWELLARRAPTSY